MLPATVRILLCTVPQDMRKSFDTLAAVTQQLLGESPQSGALYVFVAKRRTRVKILWWDSDGLAIYYKRLQRGEFQFPACGKPSHQISRDDLLRLLSGRRVSAQQRG